MAWEADVDEALDALLTTPSSRVDATSRAEIEVLLTDGYAGVLALESERRRLIEQLQPAAVVDALTERLVSLRDRLDEVNRRYGGSGKDHLDGGPGARRRADEELSP